MVYFKPMPNLTWFDLFLGAYDNEEAAARTYDLAALKYWGPQTTLNFPVSHFN